MKFYFHPQAEAELNDAVEYYDLCEFGLGLEFAEEVYSTIERMLEYPSAGVEISQNARRSLVNRFPYGVIYQKESNRTRILAIANLHKKPNYWQNRI
jgi:plasmid stabilization system protein ParE